MKKLVIDLGHGGSDPGAVGQNKTNEADIVLSIGKKLNELLKCYNLEVKFTRLTNKYLSLSERSKLANNFNSAKDKSVRGIEVWQYSKIDEKLNRFSIGLCEDISKIFNVRNRGIKLSKDFSVLKNTKMPACLVEVDFISNIAAENDLKIENNIKAVASVIRDNLLELFELKKVDSDRLYKVCIGSYKEKKNAINQMGIAKSKGFLDTYII
ncbi:N-acetylmuramoyl-L-alanine amidase family protein [Paraclostridium sordellii]|uniref:N-acetylmuramoyl-L-alanine amidase family protein n=1 Tax=Paraclostridium sordellii TaxID=1505 RepID=UPI0005DF4087|nr:N-acetylmuramoyl-L-alanine amidase [Paeniclostridium sordellii]CEN26478.1 sporulation-specific N-acetylmuramoyl-L-alanine amidase CwlC [[Clostridium] sordellii] [Paeniclostridium sordellii]